MRIVFWLVDINYDVVNDIPEIRLWGITNDNRRVVVLDRSFRPYFYVLPKDSRKIKQLAEKIKKVYSVKYKVLKVETVSRKYFGKEVKLLKVTCQIPALIPKIRDELSSLREVKEVLEADIRYYMRYMIDNNIAVSYTHLTLPTTERV